MSTELKLGSHNISGGFGGVFNPKIGFSQWSPFKSHACAAPVFQGGDLCGILYGAQPQIWSTNIEFYKFRGCIHLCGMRGPTLPYPEIFIGGGGEHFTLHYKERDTLSTWFQSHAFECFYNLESSG